MDHHEKDISLPSLLVAMPHLDDPNFKRTVVLLMEHSSAGSFGLIVNRQTPVKLKDVVQVENLEIPNMIPTWYGGPIAASYGFILRHLSDEEHATQGKDGFALSACDEEMKNMVQYFNEAHKKKSGLMTETAELSDLPRENVLTFRHSSRPVLYPYRFIIGYAGWGPGQLVSEIRAGSWIEMPLKLEWIFCTPFQNLWDLAFDSLGIQPGKIAPTVQPYLC